MAAALLTRALVAALVACLMFGLKAITIATGRDPFADPVVNAFFYAGLASLVVTFVLTGAALARRSGTRSRLVGAALGLVAGAFGGAVIALLATLLLPRSGGWVWDEVNLWVIALLTTAAVVVLRSRPARERRAH